MRTFYKLAVTMQDNVTLCGERHNVLCSLPIYIYAMYIYIFIMGTNHQ